MKLSREETSISIDEQVEISGTFLGGIKVLSVTWDAFLDGVSESGEAVQVMRSGNTPDEALKNLFEAMSEAEVTL